MQFRKTLLIGIALGLFVVLTPLAAYGAVSLFDDVPDDSIFVNDINWMKAAGVTKGCNPPSNTKYCPEGNVSREQMAAFMHRLAENQVVDAGSVQGLTANELKGQTGDPGPQGPEGPPPTIVIVPASAFHPARNTDPFRFLDMDQVVIATQADTLMCVVAPAYLPNGATIEAFTGFVRDNDPSNGIAIGMFRRDVRTFPDMAQQIAGISTQTESTGVQEETDPEIVSGREIVDNTSWGYSIQSCFQYTGLNSGVIALLAAQVELSYP
jgi:hypothetical protein